LYFLLIKYVLPPVLFTLTQVVLLSITSTFTRVQIQSNLGTTGLLPKFEYIQYVVNLLWPLFCYACMMYDVLLDVLIMHDVFPSHMQL
jgi:hypothetical protein